MGNKTRMVAIIVLTLIILMLAETLVACAQTYPPAQTAEPLLKVNLVYAYAQAPYATAILKITRIADSGLNSSTILADVYGINVFSNGVQVGTQEVVFLDGGNISETMRNPLNNTIKVNLQAYSRIDYAPQKVGESLLESYSITIDNSLDNVLVTEDWHERITNDGTTSIVSNIPIQKETLVQLSLQEFNDGYLFNTIISKQQLSHVNPFHPIANLPPSLQIVTVNANGDITSSNDGLKRKGNTYTLTKNFSTTIIVEKDNVVIDGGNYTLHGPLQNQNGVAIILKVTNITVENTSIVNWGQGILGESRNNTIVNNEFINNLQAILIHGDDYVVNQNLISDSRTAIIFGTTPYREQGDNNIITQNQIIHNSVGFSVAFDVTNSNGTTINANNVMNNSYILAISNSTKNSILYNNNFINNSGVLNVPSPFPSIVMAPFTPNVVPISPAQWDNGKIGNYWSDYETNYPQTTEIDHTGIGNTPYRRNETIQYSFSVNGYTIGSQSWSLKGTAVTATATDNHPLIAPIVVPTIALTPPSKTASTSSSNSFIFTIVFVVVALIAIVVALLIVVKKVRWQNSPTNVCASTN